MIDPMTIILIMNSTKPMMMDDTVMRPRMAGWTVSDKFFIKLPPRVLGRLSCDVREWPKVPLILLL